MLQNAPLRKIIEVSVKKRPVVVWKPFSGLVIVLIYSYRTINVHLSEWCYPWVLGLSLPNNLLYRSAQTINVYLRYCFLRIYWVAPALGENLGFKNSRPKLDYIETICKYGLLSDLKFCEIQCPMNLVLSKFYFTFHLDCLVFKSSHIALGT